MAARYPFAGFLWHLIHHAVGFSRLGIEVYCLEDHGAWPYDPVARTVIAEASRNLKSLREMLCRYGFADRWSFRDPASGSYLGMSRERCRELLRESDAVINLCGATDPREEHLQNRCMVFLETDPGGFEAALCRGDEKAIRFAAGHRLFFTYGSNLGGADCLLPTCGIRWHHTRPPVLLDEWHRALGPAEPNVFTTVGTWHNRGNDLEIGGEKYWWSKRHNFAAMLSVARRASQPIELATDLDGGEEYDRALAGGFTLHPAVPMSLDPQAYRRFIGGSRGEFTVAKDVYVRTRSGWFSDRSACYLAAGRPVVMQCTGFEKYLPTGAGLLGFDSATGAVDAIVEVNRDYSRHRRAAREIACEYFDSAKVLDEMAQVIGL